MRKGWRKGGGGGVVVVGGWRLVSAPTCLYKLYTCIERRRGRGQCIDLLHRSLQATIDSLVLMFSRQNHIVENFSALVKKIM